MLQEVTGRALSDCLKREVQRIDNGKSYANFVAAEAQFHCRAFALSFQQSFFGDAVAPPEKQKWIDNKVFEVALSAVLAGRLRRR